MRLSKALAQSGVASRRKAELFIQQGLVTVNGKAVYLPQTQVDWKKDEIIFQNKKLKAEKKLYFLFHKPKNTFCSSTRAHQERLVLDFFPPHFRLFTIGRLDRDTTGLLLVTNDGDFCQRVIHPSFGVEKEYLIVSAKEIKEQDLYHLSQGVFIENRRIRPKKVEKKNKYSLSLIVMEGKKHEVRLMAKKAQISLISLKRVRIGSIRLGRLKEGMFRPLTDIEKESLLRISL